MINLPTSYWRIDVSGLVPFDPAEPKTRPIRGGPLIDLAGLQTLLRSELFDDDAIWIGTSNCDRDLRNLRWTNQNVRRLLSCLLASDYSKSEWCQVRGGRHVPCDVYGLPFDEKRDQRHPQGIKFYLKFSLETDGTLTIVLVSCHVSR